MLGSQQTSDLLDGEMPIDAYKAFMPAFDEEFDELAEIGTRPVTHLVTDAAELTPRIEVLPANGHTDGDVMVLVADVDVLFAGDLCFFGVTPLAFQGDPATWADVLDVVAELADTIVPGHGPVGGEAEVASSAAVPAPLRGDRRGDEAEIPPGPWDTWPERDPRDAINIERAALLAQGHDEMPNSMLRAMGFVTRPRPRTAPRISSAGSVGAGSIGVRSRWESMRPTELVSIIATSAASSVVGRRRIPPISVTTRVEPSSVLVTPTLAATMNAATTMPVGASAKAVMRELAERRAHEEQRDDEAAGPTRRHRDRRAEQLRDERDDEHADREPVLQHVAGLLLAEGERVRRPEREQRERRDRRRPGRTTRGPTANTRRRPEHEVGEHDRDAARRRRPRRSPRGGRPRAATRPAGIVHTGSTPAPVSTIEHA